MNLLILILYGILLGSVQCVQMSLQISVYCSEKVKIGEFRSVICKWVHSNGTSYPDTFDAALADCPYKYRLRRFNEVENISTVAIHTGLTFYCNSSISMWKNIGLLDNFSVIILNSNQTFSFKEVSSEFKTQYFICELNGLEFGELCWNSRECNASIGLNCLNEKCKCAKENYWNGLTCAEKTTNGQQCFANSSLTTCQDYNGLSCVLGACRCNSTQNWVYGKCTNFHQTCLGYYVDGYRNDTIYTIYLNSSFSVNVKCDMTNGGWTVIASKCTPIDMKGIPQFNKSWNEFKHGFGDPQCSFWLGLDYIHTLTFLKNMTYRIDTWNEQYNKSYLIRDLFKIENETDRYRLQLGNFISGTLPSYSVANGMVFSTYDNDLTASRCSNTADFVGGWWHNGCYLDCLICQHLNNSYQPGNIYVMTITNNTQVWLHFDNFEMKIK